MKISIAGSIVTIKTTKNFWQAFALMRSKQKKSINFRNGVVLQLSGYEYFCVRDLIASGCKVEKLNDTQLKVRGRAFEIASSSELWPTLIKVQKNINIKLFGQIDKDRFRVETDKIKLFGDFEMVNAFFETTEGIYSCKCFGKSVLDVGGYQGETAAYFSSIGAKKVIVYEPVVPNHKFIEINMKLNKVNAELHKEGIGKVDGTQTVHYDKTNTSFGTLSKGQYDMEIKVRNVSNVIDESHADIAKFDCEGAEDSLVNVRCEVIRKIDMYIIEVHTSKIREEIISKFNNSGFMLAKEIVINKDLGVSLIHFKKKQL